MKVADQLQMTIKSLLIAVQDGAEDFSHRAVHIRDFLNSLDEFSLCGYTGSERECLLAVTPRLKQLASNVANNSNDVNHNLVEQHNWEKARFHIKGMKFRFCDFKTSVRSFYDAE